MAQSSMNRSAVAVAILLSGVSVRACTTAAVDDTAAASEIESAARISAGMSRLGASPGRSDCYAEKIAAALTGLDAIEALRIIESSLSKEEMRSGVLGASTPVQQSFIRAHFGCSLYP